MIITPHVLAGAAVAVGIQNPLGVIIGALATHHLLDLIPHWDYDIMSSKKAGAAKIALDCIIAGTALLAIIWNLPSDQQALILLGGLFGIFPDGMLFIHLLSSKTYFRRYIAFHNLCHHIIIKEGCQPRFSIGLATQIVAVLLALINIFTTLYT